MGRRRVHELAGQVFGRLTALEPIFRHVDGYTRWVCRCACGETVRVKTSDLTRGRTKSCGCLRRDVHASRKREPKAYNADEYGVIDIADLRLGKCLRGAHAPVPCASDDGSRA